MWALAHVREIGDSGCLLVRPDHHGRLRARSGQSANAYHDLSKALEQI